MFENNQFEEVEELQESLYTDSYIKLSKDRIIFLGENITKKSATDLSALLLYYDNKNSEEDIHLYIHCDGGDADGLINIYDVMRMIDSPIRTICMGKCYSAAAVILSAGSPGKRCAFKNSRVMIHGVQAGFPVPGHDIINSKNYYEFLKDNNDNILKILSKHTKQPLDKIKNDCITDMWMNARQALNYGLIDKIL